MDCEQAKQGVGAISAASTPPVLGPTTVHLVKYQQRALDKFSGWEVKRGYPIAHESHKLLLQQKISLTRWAVFWQGGEMLLESKQPKIEGPFGEPDEGNGDHR